ncbi:MAG: FAD-dependent oxidoreductase, partial [Candidatus Promineifilaceae bacterium]
MPWKLIRQALNGDRPPPPMWRAHELKDRYDVVIVGGGAHGLACAYYLAKNHGITDVAIMEKGYIGSGGSGRNTTIIRSNYLTPEGVNFYDESVKLYEDLSADLDFNVMFSQRGHLTLAHTDASVRTMRRRAEVNQLQGVNSSIIWPDEIKKLCPPIDVSDHPRYPILAALYHPPGGIIRHDAVVWGYAHQADVRGVHIHQKTEVTGITVEKGKVTGVETTRGHVKTGTVLNAT